MNLYTHLGFISIGTIVEFEYSNKNAQGKITGMSSIVDNRVYIYVSDSTGGYTVDCPVYCITKIIEKKDSILEDIKKPVRYNKKGKLECWDVILDQEMDFLEGNVLKYLWRYKEKNGVEDLKKAKVYLEKLISEVENNEN